MLAKKIRKTEFKLIAKRSEENTSRCKITNSDRIISFIPPAGTEEVKHYWVDEPYTFVSILKDSNSKEYLYHVSEPELSEYEQSLLEEIRNMLGDVLTLKEIRNLDEITNSDKNNLIRTKIKELLKDYPELANDSFEKIYYYIKRDFVDFGKVSPIMHDPHLEDTWCNGVDIPIYIFHSSYGNLTTNITFKNDEELDAFVMRIAHQSSRHISKSSPILDTVMQDGSRINITYGHEISPKGSSFSIRKQKKTPLTPLDLIAWKTFTSEIMAYFWLCMENGKNILVCGGTASGKTSTLNAICMFIPLNIRVVTLEDTREIQLPHENWIPTVTRESITHDEIGKIDLENLLRASLRQRPDYLLVGEVRGRESQILFQAMNAGHATCSTFHAGSPTEVINRFTNPPISVPVAMFTALDIICMQSNTYENGVEKRRVSEIAEVVGVTNGVKTKEIYVGNPKDEKFDHRTSHVLKEIKRRRGWTDEELYSDLSARKEYLEMLIIKEIRDYNSVVEWFDFFNKDQKNAYSELKRYDSKNLNQVQ
ncbi:type II/IV secretion system ATPase subunit [Methanolobus sp. ZRKC2]|uniref:type II/IV secretion system ATPase subunit n=1 Tax=Methanolobus sp. ZRKC2 TaxID=3125783 RepID=UPI003245F95B